MCTNQSLNIRISPQSSKDEWGGGRVCIPNEQVALELVSQAFNPLSCPMYVWNVVGNYWDASYSVEHMWT